MTTWDPEGISIVVLLFLALALGLAGLWIGIVRKTKTATIIGGFFLAIPVVFVVIVLLADATADRPSTTTARAATSSTSQVTGSSSLAGNSVEERLQTLQALSRTSKATIYYPGDPYAGMSIVHIQADTLAGTGPTAMIIQYASDPSDRFMTVTIYTAEQYASARVVPNGPPVTVKPHSPSDFVFGPIGAPSHNLLQSVRPGAVIVVTGDPGMTVSQLVDVAEQLRPVIAQ